MRRAVVLGSQLALASLLLTAAMSTDDGRRFADPFLSHSAWADDANPAKDVAPEKSPCSASDVVATVKSLSGENDGNPLAAMADVTFALDAIRTVSSSPKMTVCEARLTMSYDLILPTRLPQEGPVPPGMPKERKVRVNKPREVTYKVEKTDDGQDYVTVIPSDADIRDQQNADQQERERQYEMRERQNRQFELDDQRYYEQQERLRSGQ